MKLVFYSSNPTAFDGNLMHHYNFPSNTDFWASFLEKNPDYELYFITQKPGMFLLDLENEELKLYSEKINYLILEKSVSYTDFVSEILKIQPDYAVAFSFWLPPLDYLPVNDSLIGEELKKKGVKTICNPLETSLICFDKKKTADFLEKNNFKHAKSVYVNHQLFWAERNHREIIQNTYKASVFYQIKDLKFPVIIKDTCGLSSFGMEVCNTFGEVKNFLCSKKNQSDHLVEEFLDGEQFGTEIHVTENKITVFNPFIFSVNRYGITSPKQSVKLGPVTASRFKIEELKKILVQLAERLKLQGIAQVDLVFHKNEWFILEVNPRLSGMTEIIKAAENSKENLLAIKLPVLDKNQLEQICSLKYLIHLNQIKNDAALQHREEGYAEIIIPYKKLEEFKKQYPDLMEQVFYKNAKELAEKINL